MGISYGQFNSMYRLYCFVIYDDNSCCVYVNLFICSIDVHESDFTNHMSLYHLKLNINSPAVSCVFLILANNY